MTRELPARPYLINRMPAYEVDDAGRRVRVARGQARARWAVDVLGVPVLGLARADVLRKARATRRWMARHDFRLPS